MNQEQKTAHTITLDDDPMVHKVISRYTGINSLPYTSTSGLVKELDHNAPLALFVDINLGPNDCGLDSIPVVRKAWPFTPIIVMTSEESDDAIGHALATGANDFVRKPLARSELSARLNARLAEMNLLSGRDSIEFGSLRFSKLYQTISCGTRVTHLSPSEARLLDCLMIANGMVVSRSELRRRVWGNVKVSENAIDKKIFDVRTAIKNTTDHVVIKSKYGVGISLVLASDFTN